MSWFPNFPWSLNIGLTVQCISAPIERPIDVSQSIPVPEATEMAPVSPQSPDQSGGLFGWFSGNKMISKVVEKTKVLDEPCY